MKIYTYLIILFLLTNCITNNIYFVDKPKSNSPEKTISQPFFLLGIGQENTIDASQSCGKKKPSMVITKFTPLDLILGVVTFGIFSPRSIELYCE